MQVRYQAALRPVITEQPHMIQHRAVAENVVIQGLALEDVQQLFQFHAHLSHDLLALTHVFLGLFPGQALARTADGETLLVQETANLADHNDVMPLVVAPVATPLDRLELRKFLLPVAQHMRLDATQIADFPNRKISLSGDFR